MLHQSSVSGETSMIDISSPMFFTGNITCDMYL